MTFVCLSQKKWIYFGYLRGLVCVETKNEIPLLVLSGRGTSALHLNEPTWIIDGFNELIVDFLFALVLFLDSTQPRPLKYPK